MAVLPPPPINDSPGSFVWLEWYRQLRNYISQSGTVPWSVIDFTTSDIANITTRNHNNLQNMQGGVGGEYYHLTAAQHAAIGAGTHNSLSGLQGGTTGQYYHLTQTQHAQINNIIDIMTTTSGIALPTTPTVHKATTVVTQSGVTYDTSTGIYTFTNGGVYTFHIALNATPSAANKRIFFYAEENTGSGWVIKQYSGRVQELTNSIEEQVTFDSTVYFPPGMQTRHYIWADATVTLNSINVPGTTPGTVIIPAFRANWGGGI